jgi:hypothetical protein
MPKNANAQKPTLESDQLLEELSRHAGAKKHHNDHGVKQIFNLAHTAITLTQRGRDLLVSGGADRLMDGQFGLH